MPDYVVFDENAYIRLIGNIHDGIEEKLDQLDLPETDELLDDLDQRHKRMKTELPPLHAATNRP